MTTESHDTVIAEDPETGVKLIGERTPETGLARIDQLATELAPVAPSPAVTSAPFGVDPTPPSAGDTFEHATAPTGSAADATLRPVESSTPEITPVEPLDAGDPPHAEARPEVVEACAIAAHEVNRAYCAAVGDHSQLPWRDAPSWQQNSARSGVALALAGGTPRESHESWCAEKIAQGWTLGPVKDQHAKTHPCLVPYEELPAAQRAKDSLYISTVRSVCAALQPDALS